VTEDGVMVRRGGVQSKISKEKKGKRYS